MSDQHSGKQIQYRSGYKHQLAEDFCVWTDVKPDLRIRTKFITLDATGILEIRSGYSWDGASGPIADTPEVMRASLVHDALYELMRNGKLSVRDHRDAADRLFEKICVEDGVSELVAKIYYLGLLHGAAYYASPQAKRIVHEAPEEKKA